MKRPRYVGPFGSGHVWRVRGPEDLEALGYVGPGNPRRPWPSGPCLVLEGASLGVAVRLDAAMRRSLSRTPNPVPPRVRRVLSE